MNDSPLRGRRVGVTAARKAQTQIDMFERRGAWVDWAPALSLAPSAVDADQLKETTLQILTEPVDLFLATTGIGITTWFDAADSWHLGDALTERIAAAEILARGPKSAAALRRRGIHEDWSPGSECFADVLDHLSSRDLSGSRIVLQEHGQSLAEAASYLRGRGAHVSVVTVYRIGDAEDSLPLRRLVGLVADREIDAVTFTSAPAIGAFMAVANDIGRRDALIEALRTGVLAACVGPVAADAFSLWNVPTLVPSRYRLAALVKLVETALATP
ncbi:MAG: uroporphyrinogen-III synthase [Mycobacterium sp.]